MVKPGYNHFMDAGIAERLISLNRQFYQTFGEAFSATRQRLQPGVLRILDTLQVNEDQLDLGCGNGELARQRLQRGHTGAYVGLDDSPPLLAAARVARNDARAAFLQADMTSGAWEQVLPDVHAGGFPLITAFAFLHHIPGMNLREGILHKVHALLEKGGRFIHSEWQFLNSPRLKSRLQPWEAVGITVSEVDPGDHLLDWRSSGHGLRYVHHFDQDELAALAVRTGFVIREEFLSDGKNNQLAIYQVWEMR
jgi:tRNA (uracil-5-)-methyltransferase TRM9